MNDLIKDLDLENCIRFNIGKVEILLDYFQKEYRGMFGVNNLIIKANNNYFNYGWREKNKIITDLEKKGIEVKDDIYIYRNYSLLGKNPISKIEEEFKTYFEWEKIKNGEVVISSWKLDSGKVETISYNLLYDKLLFNGVSGNKENDIIFRHFCYKTNSNLYVLYKNYENNLLVGEDLAYKELADLNKWLEKDNKTNIIVVYDKDGEEKEKRILNNIDNMFSDLSREYYEEMFSFWGIDEINTIKQIKGFKYRKDFYKINIENLLYKKENK